MKLGLVFLVLICIELTLGQNEENARSESKRKEKRNRSKQTPMPPITSKEGEKPTIPRVGKRNSYLHKTSKKYQKKLLKESPELAVAIRAIAKEPQDKMWPNTRRVKDITWLVTLMPALSDLIQNGSDWIPRRFEDKTFSKSSRRHDTLPPSKIFHPLRSLLPDNINPSITTLIKRPPRVFRKMKKVSKNTNHKLPKKITFMSASGDPITSKFYKEHKITNDLSSDNTIAIRSLNSFPLSTNKGNEEYTNLVYYAALPDSTLNSKEHHLAIVEIPQNAEGRIELKSIHVIAPLPNSSILPNELKLEKVPYVMASSKNKYMVKEDPYLVIPYTPKVSDPNHSTITNIVLPLRKAPKEVNDLKMSFDNLKSDSSQTKHIYYSGPYNGLSESQNNGPQVPYKSVSEAIKMDSWYIYPNNTVRDPTLMKSVYLPRPNTGVDGFGPPKGEDIVQENQQDNYLSVYQDSYLNQPDPTLSSYQTYYPNQLDPTLSGYQNLYLKPPDPTYQTVMMQPLPQPPAVPSLPEEPLKTIIWPNVRTTTAAADTTTPISSTSYTNIQGSYSAPMKIVNIPKGKRLKTTPKEIYIPLESSTTQEPNEFLQYILEMQKTLPNPIEFLEKSRSELIRLFTKGVEGIQEIPEKIEVLVDDLFKKKNIISSASSLNPNYVKKKPKVVKVIKKVPTAHLQDETGTVIHDQIQVPQKKPYQMTKSMEETTRPSGNQMFLPNESLSPNRPSATQSLPASSIMAHQKQEPNVAIKHQPPQEFVKEEQLPPASHRGQFSTAGNHILNKDLATAENMNRATNLVNKASKLVMFTMDDAIPLIPAHISAHQSAHEPIFATKPDPNKGDTKYYKIKWNANKIKNIPEEHSTSYNSQHQWFNMANSKPSSKQKKSRLVSPSAMPLSSNAMPSYDISSHSDFKPVSFGFFQPPDRHTNQGHQPTVRQKQTTSVTELDPLRSYQEINNLLNNIRRQPPNQQHTKNPDEQSSHTQYQKQASGTSHFKLPLKENTIFNHKKIEPLKLDHLQQTMENFAVKAPNLSMWIHKPRKQQPVTPINYYGFNSSNSTLTQTQVNIINTRTVPGDHSAIQNDRSYTNHLQSMSPFIAEHLTIQLPKYVRPALQTTNEDIQNMISNENGLVEMQNKRIKPHGSSQERVNQSERTKKQRLLLATKAPTSSTMQTTTETHLSSAPSDYLSNLRNKNHHRTRTSTPVPSTTIQTSTPVPSTTIQTSTGEINTDQSPTSNRPLRSPFTLWPIRQKLSREGHKTASENEESATYRTDNRKPIQSVLLQDTPKALNIFSSNHVVENVGLESEQNNNIMSHTNYASTKRPKYDLTFSSQRKPNIKRVMEMIQENADHGNVFTKRIGEFTSPLEIAPLIATMGANMSPSYRNVDFVSGRQMRKKKTR